MAGFVPLFGDLAEFPKQLKHLDDVLEAADKAKDASKAAKVTRSLDDPESLRVATAGELENCSRASAFRHLPRPAAASGSGSRTVS